MTVDMEKVISLAGPIPFTNIGNPKVVIENFCSKDMVVVTTNKATSINHGIHVHNSFEFTICHANIPSIVADNRILDGFAGAIIAFNPMQEHGVMQDLKGFCLCGIHVNRNVIESVATELYGSPNIVFSNDISTVNHDINLLVNLFLEELRYKQVGHEFMVENLVLIIVGNLMRNIKHSLPAKPHNRPRGYKENIKKVIDYMNEHYANSFSCDELSSLINMDKFRFIRAFKKQMDKTPYEYLLDLKIEKAKKMLKGKDYSITEISMMCGFSSHSHFTTIFKKKTGLSPTEYRMSP
ncbi:MAG: helix-turn-helix domain-containing protein [Lutispora sp.]|jgi:AraC family transcriptional regulator|uniref:helix-turn-helix domain-containing protein n=1 Tax=Lutispora sp. TaxID=2828727 RepID=UPI003569D2EB